MEKTKKKNKRVIIVCALATLLLLILGIYFYATTHTQIIVGLIQKAMYQGSSPNSFEPINEPSKGFNELGQYKINDISYGTKYPNSFLDITYPNENIEEKRATIFYFHGGGFFGGSKNMGDPMAANETTALLDDLCALGYNIVNVDYALVPDYLFPVPLIQMNDAIKFISENKEKYHINMDNIIIMGSSAGAIMSAQYGAIISNPEYAALLEIMPAIDKNQVAAVVIDDSPLDYSNMNLSCKVLIGNYIKGSIYLNNDEINKYDCISYINSNYPDAFLLASEYREDLIKMAASLKAKDVDFILVDPLSEYGTKMPHCFIGNERVDPIAAEAFKRLSEFLNEKTQK